MLPGVTAAKYGDLRPGEPLLRADGVLSHSRRRSRPVKKACRTFAAPRFVRFFKKGCRILRTEGEDMV